jgi:hypothetical protein
MEKTPCACPTGECLGTIDAKEACRNQVIASMQATVANHVGSTGRTSGIYGVGIHPASNAAEPE